MIDDLLFYLPAFGSLFIALAGTLTLFLAWRIWQAWKKRREAEDKKRLP